jgi:hypothetical protein
MDLIRKTLRNWQKKRTCAAVLRDNSCWVSSWTADLALFIQQCNGWTNGESGHGKIFCCIIWRIDD